MRPPLLLLFSVAAALSLCLGVLGASDKAQENRPVIVYDDLNIAEDSSVIYEDIVEDPPVMKVAAVVGKIDEDEVLFSDHPLSSDVAVHEVPSLTEMPQQMLGPAWAAEPPETFPLSRRQEALVAKLNVFLKAYFAQLQATSPDRFARGPPWAVNIILPKQFTDPLWYQPPAD